MLHTVSMKQWYMVHNNLANITSDRRTCDRDGDERGHHGCHGGARVHPSYRGRAHAYAPVKSVSKGNEQSRNVPHPNERCIMKRSLYA
eukprot:875345-Pyramimonas_sp.AAC.1